MKLLSVTKTEWEPSHKRQQAVDHEGDADSLIINVDGQPTMGQFLDWDYDADEIATLRRYLRYGIEYQTSGTHSPRLSGISAANQYFGTVPPQPLRRRYACRTARLYEQTPQFKPLIESITRQVVKPFFDHFPDRAAEHDRLVRDQINSDWLIADTPFTSGIINNTAALPYHKDSGNLAGTWSIMLSLRTGVDGGCLNIPEYGTTLAIPDRSLTIFNGQEAWHAVTPFYYRAKDAYRFTLVWYVKEQVRHCACMKDEPKRAAIAATNAQSTHKTLG